MISLYTLLVLLAVVALCIVLGFAYIGAYVLWHRVRRLLPSSRPQARGAIRRIKKSQQAAHAEMDRLSREYIDQAQSILRR